MDAKTKRMKELVELLNQASKAYYQPGYRDHVQSGI